MKKTILVVDDFENSRFVIEISLKQAGYNVMTAPSGEQALKLVEANKFDLIVTDYNMPVMNGLELIKQIKQNQLYSYIPVLVLSTETNEEKKKEAYKAGITAWVRKPFKMEEFIRIIDKAIK